MTAGPTALRVTVERSDPGARGTFEIERSAVHVVLDALAAVAQRDPSLFFRYSCRSGVCGTCTVVADGRPVLACQTPVRPDAASIHVAPLGGFPVVRDLVVDPAPFAQRWAAAGGRLSPDAGTAGDAGTPRARRVIEDSLDCISCGACFAACDLSAADRVFLGPAALTRATVVIADRRDTVREERLAAVAGREGVEGCHGIGACSVVCPKALDPARAIRRLRRWRLSGLP